MLFVRGLTVVVLLFSAIAISLLYLSLSFLPGSPRGPHHTKESESEKVYEKLAPSAHDRNDRTRRRRRRGAEIVHGTQHGTLNGTIHGTVHGTFQRNNHNSGTRGPVGGLIFKRIVFIATRLSDRQKPGRNQ